VLSLSDAAQPGLFWAQGPVFRDGVPSATARRENHQATFEILYDAPDFAIRYSLLAACWLASRALGERWSLVLGHTDQLIPLRAQTAHYVAPGGEAWASTWQSHTPDASTSGSLAYVQQAGIHIPTLRYNSTLPPARTYYNGWFFRIYAAGTVDPVLSGGQYRDPRSPDTLHAGFGVDVERLADTIVLPKAHSGHTEDRTLKRGDPNVAHQCVQLWDSGIRSLLKN
jgi:ATP phosphoribosyltransferase regulatory subunit HisZ